MDWIHVFHPVQRRRNIFGLEKKARFSSDEFLRLCHNRNLTLFKRENIEG